MISPGSLSLAGDPVKQDDPLTMRAQYSNLMNCMLLHAFTLPLCRRQVVYLCPVARAVRCSTGCMPNMELTAA
jgi:hypothetical protein